MKHLSQACLGLLIAVAIGCGGEDPPVAKSPPIQSSASPDAPSPQSPPAPAAKASATRPQVEEERPLFDIENWEKERNAAKARHKQKKPRTLGDLLGEQERQPGEPPPAPPTIDDARAAAAGVRKLTGKHLTLYTDLPPAKEVDELPQVFDLAVKQIGDYFEIEPQKYQTWRLTGYVMDRRETFVALGLLPDSLPDFPNGYQRGSELWLYEQPSDYYRRHLLIHEGVHAFMERHLGGSGPAWYREGMAELLGTHRWVDGKLTLNWFPRHNDEAPHWGRVKIVRDDLAEGKGLSLKQVMALPSDFNLRLYGWSWAACVFFDHHPDYQERFRALDPFASDRSSSFTARFVNQFSDEEGARVDEQWQLFINRLDYGYDVAREAVVYEDGAPLGPDGAAAEIKADHGWQSTGMTLEAGKMYRLTATGRYQIGDDPKPWWCEPHGVTIHYHNSLPLGMLIGALRQDGPVSGVTPLLNPAAIGAERSIAPRVTGTLYVRVNESPSGMRDNAGKLTVRAEERQK